MLSIALNSNCTKIEMEGLSLTKSLLSITLNPNCMKIEMGGLLVMYPFERSLGMYLALEMLISKLYNLMGSKTLSSMDSTKNSCLKDL